MMISQRGVDALKQYEGFRSKAYQDVVGIWTIGYGTTKIDGKPVEPGLECTPEEAELWLRADLAWAQTTINQLVKFMLTQPMFDALVSFVYNVGQTAFSKSTMLKKLNGGDYAGAAKEFDRWVFAKGKMIPGLAKRRLLEKTMFQEGW